MALQRQAFLLDNFAEVARCFGPSIQVRHREKAQQRLAERQHEHVARREDAKLGFRVWALLGEKSEAEVKETWPRASVLSILCDAQ